MSELTTIARPYAKAVFDLAKTKAKAKEELFSASGSLFDPDVVKAFIDVLG